MLHIFTVGADSWVQVISTFSGKIRFLSAVRGPFGAVRRPLSAVRGPLSAGTVPRFSVGSRLALDHGSRMLIGFAVASLPLARSINY